MESYTYFSSLQTRHIITDINHLTPTLSVQRGRKVAFTLAEVLITLGIIGVVAALTIPTLVTNYQSRAWNTAANVFEKRLTEAVKTMNVQGKLGSYGGYKTTEGFVQELQKHFKISKVCDNDHLMGCFEDKITMNDEEVDMTTVKTAKNFGQDDWETNIVGVQVANGTNALIAYNPQCKADPYDSNLTGSSCYAIVYDTSGFSEPNELSKDLRKNGNVLKISGKSCAFKIDNICYTTPILLTETLTWNACQSNGTSTDPEDQALMKKLRIEKCHTGNDNWAAAARHCNGAQNMMSKAEAIKLANSLYNISTWNGVNATNVTLDIDKARSYGFDYTKSGSSNMFAVWLNFQDNYPYTKYIIAKDNSTHITTGNRHDPLNLLYVVCKGE